MAKAIITITIQIDKKLENLDDGDDEASVW